VPVSHLRLAYRPVRIGFLVRPRSTNDLLEAVRISSLLWGGLFNPLVPLRNDDELVDREIKWLRIDALHPVAQGNTATSVLDRHRHLRWPMIGDSLISTEGQVHLRAFDVSSAMAAFERRFAQDRPLRPAVWPVWDERDPYSLVYALTFGDFTRAEELLGEEVKSQDVV